MRLHSGASERRDLTPVHLTTYGAREAYGLIWVRLVDDGEDNFPDFSEWDDPEFIQVLPESVLLAASAGRQVEGFLDVAHFAFIHTSSFGEPDNAVVPDYPVEKTASGFVADYISSVSNLAHGFKHLAPADFPWRRRFEVWFPFTAKLTIYFPNGGRLNILNTASPISARKTRMFAPNLPQLRSRRSAPGDARFQQHGLR